MSSTSPGLALGQAGSGLVGAARSRWGWLLLAVVAAVFLAVGSVHPTVPSRSARIAALEGEIKCPSCADLSIGESDAAAALDLRAEVTRMVDAGASNAAVEHQVVAQYGTSVLLSPPASGTDLLAWLLPLVLVVGFAGGLAVFLWRRRRPGAVAAGSSEDEELVRAALSASRGPARR